MILLVRHARSVPPTADGPDEYTRPLTPDGLRQADELVAVLTGLHPTTIWSSPYRRAIQTVQPTAAALNLPVHTHPELREWDDGLAYTDDWAPHYAHSWANPSYARPGGESLDQLRTRSVDMLRTLAQQNHGRVVLVAGHGTFIAQVLNGFGQATDQTAAQRMRMPALYQLRFTDPTANPEVSELP